VSLPKVFIAETSDTQTVARLQQLGWGRMFCFRTIKPYPYEPWAFDNGAFKAWTSHTMFDEIAYLKRLAVARTVGSDPALAVVPDIVANGCESLRFSLDWIAKLPSDWPWYLAVQDGMERDDVDDVLHLFTGLFLGGTNRFKLSADKWCRLAHQAGKKFHYGRAGTLRKLCHAVKIGADSLDSSFPLWTRERFDNFVKMWGHDDTQESLTFHRSGQEPDSILRKENDRLGGKLGSDSPNLARLSQNANEGSGQ
jgi:hypothetical protein